MRRIAVTGPDGSGKSTLCRKLVNHFEESELIHAVKHRDHLLSSTTWGYKWLRKSKKIGILGERLFKYHIFYPLEYLENLKRFKLSGNTVIYDRHPIDRIILKFELLQKKNKISIKVFYLYELLMTTIWGKIYLYFFPKVDYLFVLLPLPELCVERSKGHYRSKEDAIFKINAYKQAIDLYKKRKLNVIPLNIEAETTEEKVFLRALRYLGKNEE